MSATVIILPRVCVQLKREDFDKLCRLARGWNVEPHEAALDLLAGAIRRVSRGGVV